MSTKLYMHRNCSGMDLSELFGGGEGVERNWTIYFGEEEVQVLRWIEMMHKAKLAITLFFYVMVMAMSSLILCILRPRTQTQIRFGM